MMPVRTRLSVRRKHEESGAREQGSDKFLLHHHSTVLILGDPSPGEARRLAAQSGKKMDRSAVR